MVDTDALLDRFRALLRISELENQRRRVGFDNVDLAEILREVHALYLPLAEDRGQQLALPYTFVVLALLILIIGPLAALRTPTDIFPDIRIPVIGVVWQYTGLPPDQMAGRITTPFERALTTTVNDIEHIEANSYNGFGIVKIFFQPNVDIRTANAQVTAISQTLLKQMPPGATPPLILNYSASTVPIIQLALSGEGLTEQNLADLGINQLRTPLVTVPGAAIPYPFGGKQRQVQIDLDPAALQARGLSGRTSPTRSRRRT
jgi:multidrug efflux pump subunit AcrB